MQVYPTGQALGAVDVIAALEKVEKQEAKLIAELEKLEKQEAELIAELQRVEDQLRSLSDGQASPEREALQRRHDRLTRQLDRLPTRQQLHQERQQLIQLKIVTLQPGLGAGPSSSNQGSPGAAWLDALKPSLEVLEQRLMQSLEDKEQRLMKSLEDKEQRLMKSLEDKEYLIPPDTMKRVRGSVFLVKDERTSVTGVGVGVFYQQNRAVTADHVLDKHATEGACLHADCNGESIVLKVTYRNPELDYALLEFDGEHVFIAPHSQPASSLVSRQVALCAFQVGIARELPEFAVNDLGVMTATVVKTSTRLHHLVMQSDTWPGDSGGAFVLHNGELVGIHVAGVNLLREEFERKQTLQERLTDVEASLASAARSVASGCIALHVGAFACV